MADGTRLKVLDESVKQVQESQAKIQKDFEGQQQMFHEVLSRLPLWVLRLTL